MAINVIKRDGTRAAFNEENIRNSVRNASLQAGLSEARTAEVVNQVGLAVMKIAEEQQEISTTELRDTIFAVLRQMEPSVIEAWEKYETQKKSKSPL